MNCKYLKCKQPEQEKGGRDGDMREKEKYY